MTKNLLLHTMAGLLLVSAITQAQEEQPKSFGKKAAAFVRNNKKAVAAVATATAAAAAGTAYYFGLHTKAATALSGLSLFKKGKEEVKNGSENNQGENPTATSLIAPGVITAAIATICATLSPLGKEIRIQTIKGFTGKLFNKAPRLPSPKLPRKDIGEATRDYLAQQKKHADCLGALEKEKAKFKYHLTADEEAARNALVNQEELAHVARREYNRSVIGNVVNY